VSHRLLSPLALPSFRGRSRTPHARREAVDPAARTAARRRHDEKPPSAGNPGSTAGGGSPTDHSPSSLRLLSFFPTLFSFPSGGLSLQENGTGILRSAAKRALPAGLRPLRRCPTRNDLPRFSPLAAFTASGVDAANRPDSGRCLPEPAPPVPGRPLRKEPAPVPRPGRGRPRKRPSKPTGPRN